MRIVPEEFYGGDGVTLFKQDSYFTFHECKRFGCNSENGHIEGSFTRKGKYKLKRQYNYVLKEYRIKGKYKKRHKLYVWHVSELYPEWFRGRIH